MSFLYYIPRGRSNVTLEQVRTLGLGYAIDTDRGLVRCECANGPDGNGGVVVGFAKAGTEVIVRYKPKEQSWRQLPSPPNAPSGGLPCWVGMYAQQRPEPGGLMRSQPLAGHGVTLGDGADWIVPVARGAIEEDGELRWYHALPRVTTLDESGDWIEGDVAVEYAELWSIASRWWDALQNAVQTPMGDDTIRVEFDFQGANDAAVRVLQTNYRLGRVEIAMLGLFRTGSAREILNASVDMPTILEHMKRERQDKEEVPAIAPFVPVDGSAPDDGPPGSAPGPTDRPSPICGSLIREA